MPRRHCTEGAVMCTSRLHKVVSIAGDRATVRDLGGRETTVSLIAFDGPAPVPGQWLVAHSGFALAPASEDDAEAALGEIRRVVDPVTAPGSDGSSRTSEPSRKQKGARG